MLAARPFRRQHARRKLWNNASTFQEPSAGRFPLRPAYLFLAPIALLFPEKAVSRFRLRSARPGREKSALKFQGSSVEEEEVVVEEEEAVDSEEDQVEDQEILVLGLEVDMEAEEEEEVVDFLL